MYKHILFDLDGTITDSEPGIINCIKYALTKMEVEIPDIKVLKTFIGPPLFDRFIEVFSFSEEESKKAVELYRERFAPIGLFENRVYDGVIEMLTELKKCGYTLSLATSKPEVFAIKIMDHFDLTKYFDHITGADLGGGKETKTDVMKEAISKLGAKNEEIVMVGDRFYDIESSKELGVDSIGVTYGYGPIEELEKECATYIATSPDEIVKIIKKSA